ncbi:MAG: hypothetical protein CMJ81_16720 [Planctomycetaceae bacterium]|jgi:hypothetical protein|nr:hypothetical protein [Planctomycetaceae bacterium]
MSRRDDLKTLLNDCIADHVRETNTEIHVEDETPLMGSGSPLNSIGLVIVVTNFESQLNEKFGAQVILASEQAMSMKRSPFRSVEALSDYADQLLAAESS